MTKEFEGAALTGIDVSYQQAGVGGEQNTFLDDGNISQVMGVQDPARRQLQPLGDLDGLFTGVLRNVHSVAGTLVSFVNPYDPVNVQSGYPAPIGREFDIWVMGAFASTGGNDGGDITSASLELDNRGESQMFSDLAAGGAVTASARERPLVAWTSFVLLQGLNAAHDSGTDLAGRTFIPLNFRMPRGRSGDSSFLLFRSLVTAAATTTCIIRFLITPASLGQDMAS